jgi:hypothetical protein
MAQRTITGMARDPTRSAWTGEEIEREEAAQRERVRPDGERGASRNLHDAVAHTEFARRFAEAFKHPRGK